MPSSQRSNTSSEQKPGPMADHQAPAPRRRRRPEPPAVPAAPRSTTGFPPPAACATRPRALLRELQSFLHGLAAPGDPPGGTTQTAMSARGRPWSARKASTSRRRWRRTMSGTSADSTTLNPLSETPNPSPARCRRRTTTGCHHARPAPPLVRSPPAPPPPHRRRKDPTRSGSRPKGPRAAASRNTAPPKQQGRNFLRMTHEIVRRPGHAGRPGEHPSPKMGTRFTVGGQPQPVHEPGVDGGRGNACHGDEIERLDIAPVPAGPPAPAAPLHRRSLLPPGSSRRWPGPSSRLRR